MGCMHHNCLFFLICYVLNLMEWLLPNAVRMSWKDSIEKLGLDKQRMGQVFAQPKLVSIWFHFLIDLKTWLAWQNQKSQMMEIDTQICWLGRMKRLALQIRMLETESFIANPCAGWAHEPTILIRLFSTCVLNDILLMKFIVWPQCQLVLSRLSLQGFVWDHCSFCLQSETMCVSFYVTSQTTRQTALCKQFVCLTCWQTFSF